MRSVSRETCTPSRSASFSATSVGPLLFAPDRFADIAIAADRRGMLRPGYLADLTLLDGDITTTPIGDIDKLQVLLTVCGGQITYRKPDAAIEAPCAGSESGW